mmetsp:Transcript_76921/g.220255  ORF Transcript_76921/g.220255 Transcript_76921/m.220255 type:complete len:288 (-) Transcript_76921:70-933(-)
MPPAAKRRKTGGGADAAEEEEVAEWTYDRLWDDPEISQGWHTRNVKFWRSQGADVRGATGGGVSQRDLAFSKGAVATLAKGHSGGRFGPALDLGAGIGRVTEGVLRHHCEHVDLVEFVQKHLQKAKEKLSPAPAAKKKGCTFAFHNAAVQKFDIPAQHYEFIWCQWLLMYLTDADALSLLRRLGPGIAADGMLVVKENVSTPDKLTYFDGADGELWEGGDGGSGPVSVVRTELHYEDLFQRAGLLVKDQQLQQDPAGKTMDMALFVLVPDPRALETPSAKSKGRRKA